MADSIRVQTELLRDGADFPEMLLRAFLE